MGAVLFGHALHYNPKDSKWLNRDRFILSAGHGSMFIYGWLHISGYPEVSLDQVKNFRAMGSNTPGHPEFAETPGVEATTGPLGQGIANAVGYAVSQKMAAAKYNTKDHVIFDNKVVALCGDGCMQEGVAMEAIAFAGHQRLDNLILIYDANEVTLDAMADATQSEDCVKRMEAVGFDVISVDGHDLEAFAAAYEKARKVTGKPQLIVAKTLIGKGIPEVAGTQKAHGEGGAKFADAARKALGLPAETFYVSAETKAYFAEHTQKLTAKYVEWQTTFQKWTKANPALAADLANQKVPEDLLQRIPEYPADTKIATRKAGSDALQHLCKAWPKLVGGSADLFGSTLNYIAGAGDFTPSTPSGSNIRFGIREHGMCAIMNGMAYDGIFRVQGATFLVFADYCRASIRLAALTHLPTIYIFTHDSCGVGEDGPTHQPVETVAGLRVIPNLDVIRPADPEETQAAFVAALQRTDGPTLLSLTRQAVPLLSAVPVATRREGVAKGGYILLKETAPLETILMSAGSEVSVALEAAQQLGPGVRVVSMPCFRRFDNQSKSYRDEVLPPTCRQRVAIEAGVSSVWWKYVGLDGDVQSIERFGLSAPGGKVMEALGISAQSLVTKVKSVTDASSEPPSKKQKV
uniref:transketolase n=1 Tax=Eutreptiella gymnastica TaxID=73025 RepID=A0A7S4LH27_9EUGL